MEPLSWETVLQDAVTAKRDSGTLFRANVPPFYPLIGEMNFQYFYNEYVLVLILGEKCLLFIKAKLITLSSLLHS